MLMTCANSLLLVSVVRQREINPMPIRKLELMKDDVVLCQIAKCNYYDWTISVLIAGAPGLAGFSIVAAFKAHGEVIIRVSRGVVDLMDWEAINRKF